MKAAGRLFISRGGVRLTRNLDGRPTLTILCVDRISSHQTEPWTLLWKGDEALQFYQTHKDRLIAGAVLLVEAQQLRTNALGRAIEITAQVNNLQLATDTKANAT